MWKREVKERLDQFWPEIIICHSLGCTLWFHLVQELDIRPAQKLLLVAPPHDARGYQTIEAFFPHPLPKDLKAKEVLMVTSDNDPYITPKEAETLANTLEIPLKIVPDAGHINTDSGYGEWPWVLEWTFENVSVRGFTYDADRLEEPDSGAPES